MRKGRGWMSIGLHRGFTPNWPLGLGLGQAEASSRDLRLGFPCRCQEPRHLGHPRLFSQAHQRGAGSRVGQPGPQNGGWWCGWRLSTGPPPAPRRTLREFPAPSSCCELWGLRFLLGCFLQPLGPVLSPLTRVAGSLPTRGFYLCRNGSGF